MISKRFMPLTRPALSASVCAMLLGCLPPVRGHSDTPAPQPIAGGRFEASGVVDVPASNGVLFVDDNSSTHIFWMELTADGRQAAPAVKVSLGATVIDPEGMATDGTHFYLVGSQSKYNGTEGNGIVRFRFDSSRRQVVECTSIAALKAFLATHIEELKGVDPRRGSDEELNIEGLAWDPVRSRLLLGLRAPVIDGYALVIPLKLRDSRGPFQADNLEVDGGKAIRLPLGGAGIRSLEYDETSSVFWVITGAASNDETEEFRVLEWRDASGSPVFTELARYPSRMKPEGITRATPGGATTRFLVFDTGRYSSVR